MPASAPPIAPTPETGSETSTEPPDPFEPFNRLSFAISQPIDALVFRPIALTYRAITPKPLRDGLHNALDNLFAPTTFANDLVQLRPRRALRTLARFAINSTLGVAGLFDVAGKKPFNLPPHTNSFASTLGVAGMTAGPYFYLPLLGPTSLRDMFGLVGDAFTQPLLLDRVSRKRVVIIQGRRRMVRRVFWRRGPITLTTQGAVALGLGALDLRERADAQWQALKAQSLDAYTALRSAYLQSRQAQIAALRAKDGQAPAIPALDDPLTDPATASDTPPPATPKVPAPAPDRAGATPD